MKTPVFKTISIKFQYHTLVRPQINLTKTRSDADDIQSFLSRLLNDALYEQLFNFIV